MGTFVTQPMTVYADGVRGEENTLSAEVYSHYVVTFGHVSATF